MRFIVKTALAFVVLFAAWGGLNLLRSGEMVDPHLQSMCELMETKHLLAAKMKSPKVGIIGASNVMFGYRAAMLQSLIGMPVVNLGLPATLGIDLIAANARASLRRGDIALLAAEYFFFTDYDLGPSIPRIIMHCGTAAFFGLPPRLQARTLMEQPIYDLVAGLAEKTERVGGVTPAKTFVPRLDFTTEGDLTVGQRTTRTAAELDFVIQHPSNRSFVFDPNSDGARVIRAFADWAKTNGIKVLATWPVAYRPDRTMTGDGLSQLRALYVSLDIPILGVPSDTIYDDPDKLFDTNNHLTAEEAAIRTRQVAAQIEPYLPSKSDLSKAVLEAQ